VELPLTTDLGTTQRKSLTPTQRLKLFERHKGICVVCGKQIQAGELWIDEHVRALGLGGSNDDDNRAPAHKACAADKTFGKAGDNARIAKAKRQKMRHLGIEAPKQKIQSRGFSNRRKQPRIEKKTLPPRSMFQENS